MTMPSRADYAALEAAKELAKRTEDKEVRSVVSKLFRAYWRLEQGYLYLINEGKPDPEFAGPVSDNPLGELATRWRGEARSLRRYGAESLADAAEHHADELDSAAAAQELHTVTLEEAEAIGGYSYSHLQRLVSDGTIPNAGSAGRPRILRRDVPVKPGHNARNPREGWSKLELLESSLEAV